MFSCPRCRRTSACPGDERAGWCGACREFTGAAPQEDPLAGTAWLCMTCACQYVTPPGFAREPLCSRCGTFMARSPRLTAVSRGGRLYAVLSVGRHALAARELAEGEQAADGEHVARMLAAQVGGEMPAGLGMTAAQVRDLAAVWLSGRPLPAFGQLVIPAGRAYTAGEVFRLAARGIMPRRRRGRDLREEGLPDWYAAGVVPGFPAAPADIAAAIMAGVPAQDYAAIERAVREDLLPEHREDAARLEALAARAAALRMEIEGARGRFEPREDAGEADDPSDPRNAPGVWSPGHP